MIVWCDDVVIECFIQWSKYINITCCTFRFYRRCWIISHYVAFGWSWTLVHMVVVDYFTQQDDAVSEFTLIFVLDLGMECLKHLRVKVLLIVSLHDPKSRSWVLLMSPRSCLGRFATWYTIFKLHCNVICTRYSLSQMYCSTLVSASQIPSYTVTAVLQMGVSCTYLRECQFNG
jgi:hypothetical protein